MPNHSPNEYEVFWTRIIEKLMAESEDRKEKLRARVTKDRTWDSLAIQEQEELQRGAEERLRAVFPDVKEFDIKKMAAGYSQARVVGFDAAKIIWTNGKFDQPLFSKIKKGQVKDLAADRRKVLVLVEFFRPHLTEAELVELYQHIPDPGTLDGIEPLIGTLQWWPFCNDKSGFLRKLAKRFFDLSGYQAEFLSKDFQRLLHGNGVHFSLALAETVRRAPKVRSFHSPASMGINLIGKYDEARFLRLQSLLIRDVQDDGEAVSGKQKGPDLQVVSVRGEVGNEFMRSLAGRSREIECSELDLRGDVAGAAIPEEVYAELMNDAFYCADELSCLHGINQLGAGFGLVLPLGTKHIARHQVCAKLPIHKVSLLAVPRHQVTFFEFLEVALPIYLANEVEDTAFRYRELYQELIKTAEGALSKLDTLSSTYLSALHTEFGDDFYPGVPWKTVLAERWARNVLRLDPEQLDQPLNLPWRPILTRAMELCGPIRNEYRPQSERRATASYRELEPIIRRQATSEKDFSLFGAVLGPLRPHIVLDDRVSRYDRGNALSQLGPESADVAIGFFAVPPRLLDRRFFKFPLRLKFAAAGIGKLTADQQQECKGILKILEDGIHHKIEKISFKIVVLRHGAPDNLLRGYGMDENSRVKIDDSDRNLSRSQHFLNALLEESGPAVMIADELTCLDMLGLAASTGKFTGDRPMISLGHRLLEDTPIPSASQGAYFSLGVRRSAPRWVEFFEHAIPLSLEIHRGAIVAAYVKLYYRLAEWVREQVPDVTRERAESWCRAVLTLDDPEADLLPDWRSVVQSARQQIQEAQDLLRAHA